MHPEFTVSSTPTSLHLRGKPIAGAEDRQRKIAGFDQEVFSRSSVVCIGAGGLISHIAPTVVRKGIGTISLFDDDMVEASNLNRQRFYEKDLGQNKAIALARNLERSVSSQPRSLDTRIGWKRRSLLALTSGAMSRSAESITTQHGLLRAATSKVLECP